VNLHIIPTVTHDVARDYVMLVPALPEDDVTWTVMNMSKRGGPAVVERDIVFAGLTAFQRMYDDIIVHTSPL